MTPSSDDRPQLATSTRQQGHVPASFSVSAAVGVTSPSPQGVASGSRCHTCPVPPPKPGRGSEAPMRVTKPTPLKPRGGQTWPWPASSACCREGSTFIFALSFCVCVHPDGKIPKDFSRQKVHSSGEQMVLMPKKKNNNEKNTPKQPSAPCSFFPWW